MEEYPKLSQVTQEENVGVIADLAEAIQKNESEEPIKSCILPCTNFEYEKSKNVGNLKILKETPPIKT